MQMLYIKKPEGLTLYPLHTSGQRDPAFVPPFALIVFVPSAEFKADTGETWVCSIEGDHGTVVIESVADLRKLIAALKLADETIKARDGVR